MTISINLQNSSYHIHVQRNLLEEAGTYLNLNRRVLIVTDQGIPSLYVKKLSQQCENSVICTVKEGEASKSLSVFESLLKLMLENNFTRNDCVVALGGGVVGDLAGFAASAYMRGIDFYNIPTTLLSQIDSSIGGKTGINFCGMKNIVGAFYQPKKVLIDPELLKTLPSRQIAAGMAEAIKMAMTSDEALFQLIENKETEDHLDEIILRCLNIKKNVVEQDEKEKGLRKVLNFGHTIGHGIESEKALHGLYHGECVALGMIPMCGEAIRPRLIRVLKKYDLYRKLHYDWKKIADFLAHDKKSEGEETCVIFVNQIGSFEMITIKNDDLIKLAKTCLEDAE